MLVTQKRKLEEEVRMRTKEQEILIDSLEQTVKELEDSKEEIVHNGKFMENLAMILAHDLQSPLRFFGDATDQLEMQSKKYQDQSINQLSRELKKTSVNVYGFVEDFGSWISATGKNFKPELRHTSVFILLNELNEFFTSLLTARGNRLRIDIDPAVIIITDRHLLKIILRNLIDNANKYSLNSDIRVRLKINSNLAEISVIDQGGGMPGTVAERIIKRQALGINLNEFNWEEKGHGYKFVLFFSSLLNVRVVINSTAGCGSEIILKPFSVCIAE